LTTYQLYKMILTINRLTNLGTKEEKRWVVQIVTGNEGENCVGSTGSVQERK
jgi:hypothetical protein